MQRILDRCGRTTKVHAIHATGNLPIAIGGYPRECLARMTPFPNSRHEPAARSTLRENSPRFLRDAIVIGATFFLFTTAVICAVDYSVKMTQKHKALDEMRSRAQYLAS